MVKKLWAALIFIFIAFASVSVGEESGGFVLRGGMIAGVTGELSGAEEIIVPEEIDGQRVEIIYKLRSDSVKRIVLPPSVHTICREAFSGCPNLESINLENVRLIYSGAFRGCSGLKTISSVGNLLPKSCHIGDRVFAASGLEELILDRNLNYAYSYVGSGAGTFADSGSLRAVSFTEGVTELGNGLFENCSSLDYICLPSSLDFLHDGAFTDCANLRTVVFPAKNVSVYDTAAVPSSYGGSCVFSGCPKLTILGRSGTTVEAYAEAHGIPFIGSVISAGERSQVVASALQTATVTLNGVDIPAFTVNGSVYIGENALKSMGVTFQWDRHGRTTSVAVPSGATWAVTLNTNPEPYFISVFSSDTVFYYNGFPIPALNVGNGESIIDVNALAETVLY